MAYQNKKNYTTSDEKKDYRQELIDRIVAKMEEAVEYQKPWIECHDLPFNRVSGEAYRGINFITLTMEGRSDPRWLTFKQIQDLAEKDGVEYNVKGQKGTMIQRWIPAYEGKDKEAKQIGGSEVSEDGTKSFARGGWKYYAVFNGEQIANFPKFHVPEKEFENYQPAEMLIEAMRESGLKIDHHGLGRAHYVPTKDEVWLPHKDLFKNEGLYYRTAFHEVGHATGHVSRLNRDQTGAMHTNDMTSFIKYMQEELVAELTSYIVGAELGIPYSSEAHENHAAYLKSWIGALKDKETGKQFFSEAIQEASKASDFVITRLNEKLLSLEVSKEIEKTIEVVKDRIVLPQKEEEKAILPPPGKKPVQSKMVSLARSGH